MLAAGVDRSRIARWIADGRLRRVHLGVYAVGHTAPSLHGELMAAVLACGPEAVVSHSSAGHLLGILRARPPKPEVTVPTTAGHARPGIVIHRVTSLDRLDVSSPQTSPAHVDACLARNSTKKGGAKLRRALGADATLSALEDGFLALLRRHGLPTPRANIDHAGDKVDCHWPEHDLTIELLSYRFHASRRAFEADVARRRRSSHVAFTYGDVFERAARTAAELGGALQAQHLPLQ